MNCVDISLVKYVIKCAQGNTGVLISNVTNRNRNEHVIIKSKQRFDVILTCLLHCVLAGEFDFIAMK